MLAHPRLADAVPAVGAHSSGVIGGRQATSSSRGWTRRVASARLARTTLNPLKRAHPMRPVLRTPGIYYRHESFLNDVHRVLAAEAGLKITDDGAFAEALVKKSSGQYQKQLKRQVDADLRATHAITQRRSLGETGGPGVQFDLVQLGLAATLIAGGYASWKVVADDVRAAVRRLRRISRDHVVINEDSGGRRRGRPRNLRNDRYPLRRAHNSSSRERPGTGEGLPRGARRQRGVQDHRPQSGRGGRWNLPRYAGRGLHDPSRLGAASGLSPVKAPGVLRVSFAHAHVSTATCHCSPSFAPCSQELAALMPPPSRERPTYAS